jgi:hypothetical protein
MAAYRFVSPRDLSAVFGADLPCAASAPVGLCPFFGEDIILFCIKKVNADVFGQYESESLQNIGHLRKI